LIPKARAALQRYGHQIVIGNDLHRRKHEVVFVEPEDVENRTSVPVITSDGPSTPPLEVQGLTADGGKSGAGPRTASGSGFKETWLRLDEVKERSTGADEIEIESLIVERLVARHTSWIEAGKKKA
jgi:phosphopantothenate-cysteine ligase